MLSLLLQGLHLGSVSGRSLLTYALLWGSAGAEHRAHRDHKVSSYMSEHIDIIEHLHDENTLLMQLHEGPKSFLYVVFMLSLSGGVCVFEETGVVSLGDPNQRA